MKGFNNACNGVGRLPATVRCSGSNNRNLNLQSTGFLIHPTWSVQKFSLGLKGKYIYIPLTPTIVTSFFSPFLCFHTLFYCPCFCVLLFFFPYFSPLSIFASIPSLPDHSLFFRFLSSWWVKRVTSVL